MGKQRRAWRLGLAVALTATGTVVLSAVVAGRAAGPGAGPAAIDSVRQDFNGDGYEDLAVAAPGARVKGNSQAGYVAVVYGSANGLDTRTKKVYSQASAGIPSVPERGDRFGYELKAADLDADGFTDLLVTAYGEKWRSGGTTRRNSLTVLWGGSAGFVSGKVLPAVGDSPYQDSALATGDFNGDGHQDLVRNSRVEFGPFGRDGTPAATQDTGLAAGTDQGLRTLAAGDVDGDGITDLVGRVVKSVEDEDEYGGQTNYYSLHYVRGSHDGLKPSAVLKDAQGNPVGEDSLALVLGDLNGDGRADLIDGYKSIKIYYGTTNGPDGTAPQVIDQDTPGVPGTQEESDSFAVHLTVGDMDGDGYGDILAGNRTEDVGRVKSAGTFAVIPGGPDGPTGAGTEVLGQNTAGVPGSAEKLDGFGGAVDLVDGDGDGRAEAVIGAPGENAFAGAVWVFGSTSSGVTAKGSFFFGPRTLGLVPDLDDLGEALPN